jgi:hypothetical protein
MGEEDLKVNNGEDVSTVKQHGIVGDEENHGRRAYTFGFL